MKRIACCVLLCTVLLQVVHAQTYKIYIDPGHYRGAGASFENEKETVTEEEVVLIVALKLRNLLITDTFTGVTWDIRMSRETMESRHKDLDSPGESAKDASSSDFKADLFLSIHCNSAPGKEEGVGDGTETFWGNEGEKPIESERFARIVQRHMVHHGEWKHRRVADYASYRGSPLAVLRNLQVPGCLSEIGFLNTQSNREKLVSSYWQHRFAEAYRDAIFEHLGLPLPRYFSITLEPGENILSIPGIPANPDPRSLIGKKALTTPIVRWFDPSDRRKYSVTTLQFGQGYWMYSLYDDVSLISYFPKYEYTIHLDRGFNMIGSTSDLSFFATTVRSANRAEERINEVLWTWDAQQQRFVVARLGFIEPGSGYYVQAYHPTDITVSTPFAGAGAPPVRQVPQETRLLANFPNPFNPETWIPFSLSQAGDVTISIHTVSGHLVRKLHLGHLKAGFYSTQETAAHWDGSNAQGDKVASGVYFYTLDTHNLSFTGKMLLLK